MPITNPTVAPTPAEFLADFPEFAPGAPGVGVFPPSAINYWLQVAILTLNVGRWQSLYYLGVELFMAHNLALEAWSAQGAPGNQQVIPGISKGAVAGKSAGDVSISYNNAAVMDMRAAQFNNTTYGARLWNLIQMIGMGPLQVGPQGCAQNGAWSGPWVFQIPNPEL